MLTSMPSFSSPAAIRVEKATSDLLILPDWTMNVEICDLINSSDWDAKDVIRAVKKRLQNKNPKVQLLSLTLLETLVKNCGDYLHFQIVDRNVLQEMIKIVKKKVDMDVREKILVLLDSWQEAFGGPRGKYPQYYWAYEELRRSGVVFPQHSVDAAPIFTPPAAQSKLRHAEASYGMPLSSSTRLEEAMAAEIENLSLSSINSMREVLNLLLDMLQAVNPTDHTAVKDEVIVDLTNQCRSNQRKLMQMLTTTVDEVLLGQGLELNDSMQTVLAKHDAIASGSPLPKQVPNLEKQSIAVNVSNLKPTEVKEHSETQNASPSTPVASISIQIDNEEDEDDGFTQLARRHSKTQSTTSQESSASSRESVAGVTGINVASSIPATTAPLLPCNTLTLPDLSAPAWTTKDQDIIDLLSITVCTATSPPTPQSPAAPYQNIHQGFPYASQASPINEGQVPLNSYVAPWAQPQGQIRPQPQLQLQSQPQYPEYRYGYIPPPWAPTPGYLSNQNHFSTPYMYSTQQADISSTFTSQGERALQPVHMHPSSDISVSYINREPVLISGPRSAAPAAAQKTFIPSYRLFEDLNVLGNADGRFPMMSSTSPGLSGSSSQSMVSGRK